DLRVQLEVGAGLGAAADRPRRDAGLAAEGELARDQRSGAALGHEEEHEVGALASDLEAHASAGEGDERDRAPSPGAVTTADDSASVAGPVADRSLDHVRDDGDAVAALEQRLGDASIGLLQQLAVDVVGIAHPLLELGVAEHG